MFKNRTFVKYFISYLVLLISIFSVLTFIFANVLFFMSKEIETSIQNQFEQIGLAFENELASLKSTVALMHTNEHLTQFRLSNGDYMAYTGIKELKKIRASNSFIGDVLINYKDNDIYSAKGKVTVDIYTRDILELDENSALKVQEVLVSAGVGFYPLYPSGSRINNQPAYLMYSSPFTLNDKTIATASFIIAADTIKKALANLLKDYGSGVRMSLPSGEVFTQVCQSGVIDPFEDNNKKSYLYYTYKTGTTGFTFNVAIDSKKAFSQIRHLQEVSYIIILTVFLLSILLSYLFSKRHYRPIEALIKKVVENDNRNLPAGTCNEFDTILNAMNFEMLKNRKMSEELDANNFDLRQQACMLIFSGVVQNEARIQYLMYLSEININMPYYSVMIITQAGTRQTCRSISSIYAPIVKRFGTYYITSVMENMAIAVVVSLQDKDLTRKLRKQIAKEVQIYFDIDNSNMNYICFGKVYEEIGFLSQSYSEAMICSEQSRILNKYDTLLFYEDLAKMNNKIYSLDRQGVAQLFRSLEKKDLDQIIDCFNGLMKKLHDKELTPETLKFHYHDLKHEIFHYFMQNNLESYAEQMMKIECSSAERYILQMKKLFQHICKEAKQDSTLNIGKVIKYLEDNYKNCSISLSQLAHQFLISPNYLSKYFKEMTGVSYIQYLSNLRIEEAHRLICSTDLPIHDITQMVGYLDPVNFTKKFKKIYNVTPSELRQKINCAQTQNAGV